MKSNKISVLQTAGKGTSCPACVWQTDLHTGTAAVCEPALSLLHTTAAIYLYGSGTVYSNTVKLKFHLIQSFFEIFAKFLLFHV